MAQRRLLTKKIEIGTDRGNRSHGCLAPDQKDEEGTDILMVNQSEYQMF
mgnify:CR=1 FL=1